MAGMDPMHMNGGKSVHVVQLEVGILNTQHRYSSLKFSFPTLGSGDLDGLPKVMFFVLELCF